MFDLSGLVFDSQPIIKNCGNKVYEIKRCGGHNKNKYVAREMKDGVYDGKCQLFENGLLKLAWTMTGGENVGVITMYEKGKVVEETSWENLNSPHNDIRYVCNESGAKKRWLIIKSQENDVVIYRGEYNATSLQREGFGIEYDQTTGVVLRTGYFRDDHLVHLHQQFLVDNGEVVEMMEYFGNADDNNLDLLCQRPVYVGGFVYDEVNGVYYRHGKGSVIDSLTGVCV